MRSGRGDETASAQSQGHDGLRTSHADRERVLEVLKVAFVEERLAKDEFELRVGRALAARTYAELDVVAAGLPTEPASAKPPSPVRAQGEPGVVRPGPLLGVATAVCASVWLFGFLVPWPRDAEGDLHHGSALLVYLTTFIYLFVVAMTVWLGAAVMVESWLRRRSGGGRVRHVSS